MKTYPLITLVAWVFISMTASAAAPAPCHVLLTVELTPDKASS